MTDAPKFPWRVYIVLAILIIVIGLLPLFGVVFADTVANLNGCTLNEGTVHVCMVGGSDWGGLLYALFVLAWLLLATLPLAGGALLVLLVILIIHFIAWRRSSKVSS